jgi:DNA-directed RNA polymerase subunit RPC12/RpoP
MSGATTSTIPGLSNNNTTSTGGSSATPIIVGGQHRQGVEYRCGDCGYRTHIRGGDPVRCRHCGFRILYKIRTRRCMYMCVCF